MRLESNLHFFEQLRRSRGLAGSVPVAHFSDAGVERHGVCIPVQTIRCRLNISSTAVVSLYSKGLILVMNAEVEAVTSFKNIT